LRNLKFATLIFICAHLLACAAKSPMGETVQIGAIHEYDKKVDVKPIEPALEATPADKTAPPPKTPELGLEAQTRAEIKKEKAKVKKGEMKEEQIIPHLPETEDSEGFNGRRPVKDPFRVGEKVVMMLTYFGVSAGDASLEIKPFVQVNGRKAYHFYSKLDSSPVFSMFYKVDDYCESFVDYEQMVPLNFTLSAKETKQLREIRTFFDWKKKEADFWEKKITKESGTEEKKKNWALRPFSQNVYTALQYARVFQLKVGKTYEWRVSDEGRAWDVKATVLRKEKLKTDIGTFDTLVIRPEVETAGILQKKGEVLFWVTDDDRKFPVRLEAKIKIGKVIGYLKAIEKGQE
jgi:hypothetical protein